jgi:hypothetical protein
VSSSGTAKESSESGSGVTVRCCGEIELPLLLFAQIIGTCLDGITVPLEIHPPSTAWNGSLGLNATDTLYVNVACVGESAWQLDLSINRDGLVTSCITLAAKFASEFQCDPLEIFFDNCDPTLFVPNCPPGCGIELDSGTFDVLVTR